MERSMTQWCHGRAEKNTGLLTLVPTLLSFLVFVFPESLPDPHSLILPQHAHNALQFLKFLHIYPFIKTDIVLPSLQMRRLRL
jgi:hypothetical protein